MKKRSPITIAVAAALAVALGVSLAACEGEVPTVSSSASASAAASPDLTEEQEKEMREALLKTITECNDAKTTEGLDTAMTGPELQIRTSEIEIAQKTGNLDAKTEIPTDITQTVIPTDSGWPRSVFSITTTTSDQQSKRLLVFTQDSARSNYKLWGVARLFQGVSLPKFEIPSIGSSMGTDDDSGLVMTPKEAVERYADVLTNGDSSQYAGDFTDDYFRQELAQLEQTVAEAMQKNDGTSEQVFTADLDEIKVMRSADGGDLVVAQINSVWTRAAGSGRESQPASDAERALFGDGTATSTMKVTYVNVVALYVPPASSGDKVTAVGAERQAIKVEAV
ncbi:hypothetical protein [Bifidobacterium choloepi]|uniref:DUF8094 domain-containing protein n=1 Tax=Bifidobacterium choloepi TaxID=2614131 RepID=A0A6I5N0A3_9BIFI|nr:hypothetical protein [Bifidobacterium choloepi]NEG70328.1 hypothetical protein [Bifidobacterium choloepi]